MTTADQKALESAQTLWRKEERMAMSQAAQSATDAETWLRDHICWDLFIIRLSGNTKATEIAGRVKRIWQKLLRTSPESFPNTIQMWLLVLGNPKNPDALNLFYFVSGVEHVSYSMLKNLLEVEFRNLRTLLPRRIFPFSRVAKWFCKLCGQSMLIAFIPMEFHARYRWSWRLREIR